VAKAYYWVSVVTTSVGLMVLPGLGGHWLDSRYGTRFLGLLGFAGGLVGGVAYLLAALKQDPGGGSGGG
jgi:hypothetical protein